MSTLALRNCCTTETGSTGGLKADRGERRMDSRRTLTAFASGCWKSDCALS